MSIGGSMHPIARLGGKRYRRFPTRKELKDEVADLTRIRDNLRKENENLRIRLDAVRAVSDPDLEVTIHPIEEG